MLLFGVASLMIGSTTGVLTSPGHGGNQATATKEAPRLRITTQRSQHTQHLLTTPRPPSATPPRLKSYATNYAAPSYITEALEYYTTEYTVPAYYTEVPKYYTTTNAAPAYYTEAPAYFNAKAVEYYTEPHKYYSAPKCTTTTEEYKYYVAQTYNTAVAPSYYVELKYYTEAPIYYTTTYATPRYYDKVPNYYTEEATLHNHVHCPQFTTLRNPSITLLQATTKLRVLFTTPSHRVLQPNGKYSVFTWSFILLFFFCLLIYL